MEDAPRDSCPEGWSHVKDRFDESKMGLYWDIEEDWCGAKKISSASYSCIQGEHNYKYNFEEGEEHKFYM